jgi:hypothetical protein
MKVENQIVQQLKCYWFPSDSYVCCTLFFLGFFKMRAIKRLVCSFSVFFLSPFLKMVVIMAHFILEGKIPDIIDILKI